MQLLFSIDIPFYLSKSVKQKCCEAKCTRYLYPFVLAEFYKILSSGYLLPFSIFGAEINWWYDWLNRFIRNVFDFLCCSSFFSLLFARKSFIYYGNSLRSIWLVSMSNASNNEFINTCHWLRPILVQSALGEWMAHNFSDLSFDALDEYMFRFPHFIEHRPLWKSSAFTLKIFRTQTE